MKIYNRNGHVALDTGGDTDVVVVEGHDVRLYYRADNAGPVLVHRTVDWDCPSDEWRSGGAVITEKVILRHKDWASKWPLEWPYFEARLRAVQKEEG